MVNVFSLFPYHFPLKKGVVLPLNKLVFPLPNYALCQVLIGCNCPSGSEEDFVHIFSLFRNYVSMQNISPQSDVTFAGVTSKVYENLNISFYIHPF